jgi:hypothetical protein
MQYPDGAHNAETLLADPDTADLYIVTKDTAAGLSHVLRYPFPHADGSMVTLEWVAQYQWPGGSSSLFAATGGDIAPDGREIAVRTYAAARLWPRAPGASVAEAFAAEPCTIPLASEPQGETLTYAAGGLGYFTLSEGSSRPIYRFDRLATPTDTPTMTPTPVASASVTATPGGLCAQAPRECVSPARASLVLRHRDGGTRDRLKLRMKDVGESEVTVFGNPQEDTTCAFCLYLGDSLIGSATVPPGSLWQSRSRKMLFRDHASPPAHDGITRIVLEAGESGVPAPVLVQVRGRGAELPLPALPLSEPFVLTVQVSNSSNEDCWEASFTTAERIRNDADVFRAGLP